MKFLASAWENWKKFWFAPIDLFPAAVFRICLSVTLFLMYALRQINLLDYFSDRSMVPRDSALELLPDIFRPIIFWFPSSNTGIISYHLLLLLCLALIGIGFYSRVFSLVALVICFNFLHRNFAVAYGADIIACFWLFYFSFVESDRELSVRKKFNLPSFAPKFENFSLSTMGVRLVQIQLCIIYAFTGLEKLKGGVWWEGTAIWQVMGNQQLSTIDLSFLQNFPLVIVFMTYATLIYEIYFAVCVWIPKIRPWWLTIGVLFHVGIALSMGLIFFSGVMISAYILFLNGDRLRQRLNLPQARA